MTLESLAPTPTRHGRVLLWSLAGLAGGITARCILSPRPGALLIRRVFGRATTDANAALAVHEPTGVESVTGMRYRHDDPDALFDVHFPVGTDRALPTVVWTHGGAWISGHRSDYATYHRLIAARGYTVISVGYSLGPERTYPTAVHQLNDAHAHLIANARDLHIDPDRIVLAGDSAGAQLSSQLAAAVTDPGYAAEIGVVPALTPDRLRAVVLNCGIYDVPAMTGGSGLIGWGADHSLWAYTGVRDVAGSPAAAQMSTLRHVTADFPPTYLSGGNADPLTATQSRPLAEALTRLGVDVTEVFYPDDHEPPLAHEYQFDLDTAAGAAALEKTVAFLAAHTR
ncbi:alpha/beta hydrolase [Rhodococcus sp. NPDC004095]